MIVVRKYTQSDKPVWDCFVSNSKNGTFMLKRDFVEYHSDRFTDFSLLIYQENTLIMVVPASINGDEVVSHGGLTYGGFIIGNNMTMQTMLQAVPAILEFLSRNNIKTFFYKRVPAIYYRYPADEDVYALFRNNAELYRRDISTAIYLPEKIRYSERRRRNVKKAIRAGLLFGESNDFDTYISMLTKVLSHHGVSPVHSSLELRKLADSFPDNIKLYTAYKDGQMLAGTLLFIDRYVVHTQYIANSEEGRNCGALDFIIDKLINEIYSDKKFFDFGISTENGGHYLNEGLIEQKQEFGGRGIIYDFYKIQVK